MGCYHSLVNPGFVCEGSRNSVCTGTSYVVAFTSNLLKVSAFVDVIRSCVMILLRFLRHNRRGGAKKQEAKEHTISRLRLSSPVLLYAFPCHPLPLWTLARGMT